MTDLLYERRIGEWLYVKQEKNYDSCAVPGRAVYRLYFVQICIFRYSWNEAVASYIVWHRDHCHSNRLSWMGKYRLFVLPFHIWLDLWSESCFKAMVLTQEVRRQITFGSFGRQYLSALYCPVWFTISFLVPLKGKSVRLFYPWFRRAFWRKSQVCGWQAWSISLTSCARTESMLYSNPLQSP